ncbi:MAG: hypothetical protein GY792_05940 [Gammaproteobacteria bacterium]|nr:hypothetical protein [Gammaproteobacteria bacterium]
MRGWVTDARARRQSLMEQTSQDKFEQVDGTIFGTGCKDIVTRDGAANNFCISRECGNKPTRREVPDPTSKKR